MGDFFRPKYFWLWFQNFLHWLPWLMCQLFTHQQILIWIVLPMKYLVKCLFFLSNKGQKPPGSPVFFLLETNAKIFLSIFQEKSNNAWKSSIKKYLINNFIFINFYHPSFIFIMKINIFWNIRIIWQWFDISSWKAWFAIYILRKHTFSNFVWNVWIAGRPSKLFGLAVCVQRDRYIWL